MSSLLISLCNLPVPGETALLELDLDSKSLTPVNLGTTVPIKTCTGLARDSSRIYVLCADAHEKFYLACLGAEDFRPLYFQSLPEVLDGHSIVIDQGSLYVVSTGNDSILRYRLDAAGVSNAEPAWSVAGSQTDTHHINSLVVWNGELVFSAFGPRSGKTWSTAVNGYLFNIARNARLAENIYQPHSLKEWGGDLFYCESARGKVAAISSGSWETGDYTRGLDFVADTTVAVGSSIARTVSKSTGLINNPGDPGSPTGQCEVNFYRLAPDGGVDRIAQISIGSYAPEIYDLLYLGAVRANPGIFRRDAQARPRANASESQGNPSADLLEQHQAMSELKRALETTDYELDKLYLRLKSSRDVSSSQQIQLAMGEVRLKRQSQVDQIHKQTLAQMNRDLEQKDLELERGVREVTRMCGQLELVQAALERETAQAHDLRVEVAEQQRVLAEIVGSRCWRWTAPIRWLSGVFRHRR